MKRFFLALLSISVLASCQENNAKKQDTNTEKVSQTETKTNNNNSNSIILGSTDQMTFTLKEIRVKAGQKVTLTLEHLGKMKKEVMGHNFVLLKQGVDIANFAQLAMKSADNQYIPKDSQDVIAYTNLIGGGEKDTITFDAPSVMGEYDFICSFPGHYAIMKGKFIVE